MIDKRRLLAWLDRVARERHGEPLTRVELVHATADASQGCVEEWEIRPDTRPMDLAPEIIERASDDAQALGSWQTYALFPYYGDSETPLGRFCFGIQGTPPTSFSVGQSEPANAQGLVAQMMRHTEACMRVTVSAMEGIVTQQADTIRAQRAQLDEHERRHVETVATTEQMLSMQHERDLASKRAENHEKRVDQMLQTSIRLLPSLAGHLAARVAPPPSPPPPRPAEPSPGPVLTPPAAAPPPEPVHMTGAVQAPPPPPAMAESSPPAAPTVSASQGDLLRQILTSLTDEQMEPLQRVLTPDQQIALLTLYQQMQPSEVAPAPSTPSSS